jgi:formylglycine-generating enzyme required for sulfatase activity
MSQLTSKKSIPENPPPRWHFPLTEFIELLKTNGFIIGVDTQIAIHTVIQQFQLPTQLDLLVDYLAPVVAQNAEQQQFFKAQFKHWFFIEKEAIAPQEAAPKKGKKPPKPTATPPNPNPISPTEQPLLDENEKLILNLSSGSPSGKGLSFAVPPVPIEYSAGVLHSLRQLRFMTETQRRSFDLAGTIKQLSKKGELDEPFYSFSRKHTEYLIIVEQNAVRNHLAAFVQNIYATMLANNVDAMLYTYQTDPRVLYAANGQSETTLRQLAGLHHDAVLLYFGGNELWQNSETLQIYNWTDVFKQWERRYWFPTKSPEQWDLYEQAGSSVFPHVLPTSFAGLQTLSQHLSFSDNDLHVSLGFWEQHLDYNLTAINTRLPLDTIALFFSPQMRTWIAACAVYPEINWDLTLELGRLRSTEEHSNLCHAEAISQLLRLDWFRKGHMPPELRYALLEFWISPNQVMQIHAHIAALMRNDTRYEILSKFPAFRMQLALHELMGENDEEKRQQKAEVLIKDMEAGQQADFVSLQYINQTDWSPVFFEIPADLRHLFEQVSGKTLQKKMRNFRGKIGKASFEMVFVGGGSFQMGSDEYDSEKPIHEVTVPDFYMGKYPVTLAEFAEFVQETKYQTDADKGDGSYVWDGSNYNKQKGVNWRYGVDGKPRPSSDYNHPVIHVSWDDSIAYVKWLSAKTKKNYRLPSEAEWEFAALGGQLSQGYTYAGSNNIDEVAWYNENSDSNTHPVGQKKPNELDLYDLSGNVWEWCQDEWHKNYQGAPTDGSAWQSGLESGSDRVYRGGSWIGYAVRCRVAHRIDVNPDFRSRNLGFRIVFVPQLGG